MKDKKELKRVEISGVDVELFKKLKSEAKKEGLTVSAFLRELLKVYFN